MLAQGMFLAQFRCLSAMCREHDYRTLWWRGGLGKINSSGGACQIFAVIFVFNFQHPAAIFILLRFERPHQQVESLVCMLAIAQSE